MLGIKGVTEYSVHLIIGHGAALDQGEATNM
jgi:hypothetical protein